MVKKDGIGTIHNTFTQLHILLKQSQSLISYRAA